MDEQSLAQECQKEPTHDSVFFVGMISRPWIPVTHTRRETNCGKSVCSLILIQDGAPKGVIWRIIARVPWLCLSSIGPGSSLLPSHHRTSLIFRHLVPSLENWYRSNPASPSATYHRDDSKTGGITRVLGTLGGERVDPFAPGDASGSPLNGCQLSLWVLQSGCLVHTMHYILAKVAWCDLVWNASSEG